MLEMFVSTAMKALMSVLTPEKIRGFIEAGADRLTEYVTGTENKLDDALVPAVNLVLAAIDVPGPDGKIDVSAELMKLFALLEEQKDLFVDAGLDYIEDNVAASESKIDDMVVLPMCNLVRSVLNVPDNDEDDVIIGHETKE